MEKEQIFSLLRSQMQIGAITAADVRAFLDENESTLTVVGGAAPQAYVQPSASLSLINVFYAIGALIAIIGAVILVSEHWEEIGYAGRILVTLGISLVTYISAMLLRGPSRRGVSQALFVISASLAPVGVMAFLREQGMDFALVAQAWTGLALAVIYAVALLATRRNILVLASVGFSTWAFFAFALHIVQGSDAWDFVKWGSLVAGIAYVLIGYWYRASAKPSDAGDAREKGVVGGVLYAFGTLGALGAGIALDGFFDFLYIPFVFGAFYLSVYLRSRAMLVFAALFLIGDIIKLTSRYFVGSLGWPIALVIIGFLVIGVGALTYRLSKRFGR